MARAEYRRLRERLDRMAASEHFITTQSEKDAIGKASVVIGKLLAALLEADAAQEARDAEIREARAETWDEAVETVFRWWQTPDDQKPMFVVNPYGVGLPGD